MTSEFLCVICFLAKNATFDRRVPQGKIVRHGAKQNLYSLWADKAPGGIWVAEQIPRPTTFRLQECFCAVSRDNYWRKHVYYLQKAARQRKVQIKRLRQFVVDYLGVHSCIDCGETNPVCLEFDHVRGRKYKAISAMIASAASIAAITKEISKCEVRCANCHRKKTAKQQRWYNTLR